ncbi:MAG: signal peptidase I [Bacillota bacterium]|nr:signal peptidase I [Bacillota bacterium]MDW7676533.1 signal peptidase I [Bacillota bacterium]
MKLLLYNETELTAELIENLLPEGDMKAEIAASSSEKMALEILRNCDMDVVVHHSSLENDSKSLHFFEEVAKTGSDAKKVLILPRENLPLLNEELAMLVDDYLTTPLDQYELTLRLKKLMRELAQSRENAKPAQLSPRVYKIKRSSKSAELQELEMQPAEKPELPEKKLILVTRRLESRGNKVETAEQASASSEDELTGTGHMFRFQTGHVEKRAGSKLQQRIAMQQREDQKQEDLDITQGEALAGAAEKKEEPEMLTDVMTASKEQIHHTVESGHEREPAKRSYGGAFFRLSSKVIFGAMILMIAFLAFFLVQSKITGGTPTVAGYQFYTVLSGSMNPSFDTGSLIFVKKQPPETIAVGDIITFAGPRADSALTTHRVAAINNEVPLSFITRGDANNVNDPNPVPEERVIGTVRGFVPYLGYIMGFAQTRAGLIFLVFIPGVMIIIFEIFNIFRLIKTETKKETA